MSTLNTLPFEYDFNTVDDFGIGTYDSPGVNNDDEPVRVTSIPTPSEAERDNEFYSFSSESLPSDDALPVARSDYYDYMYIGKTPREVDAKNETAEPILDGFRVSDMTNPGSDLIDWSDNLSSTFNKNLDRFLLLLGNLEESWKRSWK